MSDWPKLDWPAWRETSVALQLRLQILGKLRVALTPWLNHSWQVPFYVTARGLGSSPIPFGHEVIEAEFDLVDHVLVLRTSLGAESLLPLAPGSIAAFHASVVAALADLGVVVDIDPKPSEMPGALPFAQDHEERSYDPDAAHDFWRALLQVNRVLHLFRSGFIGKASPIHVFWGSFDIAATRFSGRTAPLHPGGLPGLPDAVTCEAYSHEEASAGFWPGNDAFPTAAFYAYAYPSPAGYADAAVRPAEAGYNTELGEFILPYEAVRTAADPDAMLLEFLQSTYDAAADLGKWDRAALECPLGRPRIPRHVA